MMPSFASFLPRGLRSLLDYISPAAFDVVDWKAAVKRSSKISSELILKSSLPRIMADMNAWLPLRVAFDKKEGFMGSGSPLCYPDLSAEQKVDLGERILRIYFMQLRRGRASFLDLRSQRFELGSDGTLLWKPNGLWTAFSTSFLNGLNLTYDGFYLDDEDSLYRGLSVLGLLPECLGAQEREFLLRLLNDHFAAGRDSPMIFKVESFMHSFDRLFVFLRDHKIRLSEDFLFLGVQLLTLYMHLEECGESLRVREAFHGG